MTNWRRVKVPAIALLGVFVPLLGAGDSDAQTPTPKTTTYKYDALGRLTFVEDSQNGNRDYDYDAAGNRRNVAVGTANDGASEPAPLPPPPTPSTPTNLTSSYVADCSWHATWAAVPGATSYMFQDTQNPAQSLTETSKSVFCTSPFPNSNKPVWVQACNANGCSAIAYF